MKGFCKLFSFLCLLLFLPFCACSTQDKQKVQLGDNSYYFMALNNLKEKKEMEAVRLLQKGTKKSNDFFARKCMEKLTTLGTVSERISTALRYAEKYNDSQALLRAVQELATGEEYEKIISVTGQLSDDASPELVKLRLYAVATKGRTDFAGEIEDWFLHHKITIHHKEFFDKFQQEFLLQTLSSEIQLIIDFRMSVFNKDYYQAFKKISKLLNIQSNPAKWLASQSAEVLSDIGKTFLYGNTKYLENARLFDSAAAYAREESNKEALFYLWFYSGRLYDRASSGNIEKALDRFDLAMHAASDTSKYDNALWYYFSTALKDSTEQALRALEKYAATIQDAWYYSDFFETLCQRVLAESDWTSFYAIYNLIDGHADEETCSKYAYLCARLFQLGLLASDNSSQPQDIAQQLFDSAYKPGGMPYYRIMAAYQMGLADSEIRRTIYNAKLVKDFVPNQDKDTLMAGYIAFNLPEEIYPEWNKSNKELSFETEAAAAHFLSRQETDEYSLQSLRIISNSVYHADSNPEEWMYKMVYPRLFYKEISEVCTEFGLSEYVFLGLVRSESFFDSKVASVKGATGLTQLMPTTAGDIARKLKVTDYDLKDVNTNLRFGAFYLADLVRRLDGSILDALCSYNAGPRRFGDWQDILPNLPKDLLLELLPFEETRSYGKKILTAAVFYGTLYYEKTYAQVIEEIIDF